MNGVSQKVRVGIVGLGGISYGQHIPGYLLCENAEIVALCDMSEAALQKTGAELGVTNLFTEYDRMLEMDLDAVSVCTWPDMHYPMSMAAIARGMNVFCEKPLALNYPLACEMLQAARSAGVVTAVGFTHRLTPAAMLAHRLISSGALGGIYHVVAVYANGRGDFAERPMTRRRTKAVTGGGPLFELGPHMVDMVRWWTGEEIAAVCAQTRTFVKQRRWPDSGVLADVDVDDGAVFMSDLSGGGTALFINSSVYTGRNFDQRVEVYGEHGSLIYDQARPNELRACIGDEMVRVWSGYGLYDPRWGLYRQEESLPVIPVPSDLLDAVPGARVGRPMRTFVPDFVATICGEERPMLPTFYEGMKAQEVLDAVLLSADQRRWVDLPL